MSTDDFKHHALNSSHDFYHLLGIPEGASDSEIRSAYRKATLRHHPDKVGASPEALEKWHLLQIAHEVLSDATVRELYNNARRARAEKKQRDEAYEGRRRWMKEDLERRESGALKRKREEADAEEAFDRELRRIAEDNKRRRKEMEEKLREEARKAEEEEETLAQEGRQVPQNGAHQNGDEVGPSDIDRSITFRFPKSEADTLSKERLSEMFSRFGTVEEVLLRDKKVKVPGEKHRKDYIQTVVVFKSIVGAHAAVSDSPKLQKQTKGEDGAPWQVLEALDWASGKEPNSVPKPPAPAPAPSASPTAAPSTPAKRRNLDSILGSTPKTPQDVNAAAKNGGDGGGLKKVPSFASFKGTPGGTPRGPNSPSLDEITMMRLKNAERRRLEEKIRKEEEVGGKGGEM